jgi:hypothetical protein
MTFETTVKTYPLVTILNDHDKDIIKKYISMVEARGKWTYTMEMMKNVFLKAEELESKDKKRQRVIVIMTDGIDDPPPEGRRERLSIKDVTKEHLGKDWFIYFVNLADLKNNKKLLAVQKYLKEHVAKHTRIIDADKNIKQGIEKDIHADVDKTMAGKGSFFTSPYFIAGIIILILLIILFFIKRFLDLKVHGKLDYWNHTILDPYTEHYNLTRHNTRMIRIGKSGSVVNVRDLEVHEPFTLLAVREKGQIKCQIIPGSNYTIAIDGKEGQSLLEDGDIFKVSNYTFKYIAD